MDPCFQLLDSCSCGLCLHIYIEAIPISANDAKIVLKIFENILFPKFGIPRAMITDDGSHFISKVVENLLKQDGIKHKLY